MTTLQGLYDALKQQTERMEASRRSTSG